MTTITLKINERTKAGKTLLAMLNFFTTEKRGVDVCSMPNFETVKAMYDAKNNIGNTKTTNHAHLMKELFS
ncbi:MAG: hypothetical protein H7331_12055 [Bacteroidia bacterium]|nr:hypothetical protein [Bacteroidia bacterium]